MSLGLVDSHRNAEQAGLALTWLTCLIDALPHLTLDLLGDGRWPGLLDAIAQRQERTWRAAKQAMERIFVLLKAYKAGLRREETNGHMPVNVQQG